MRPISLKFKCFGPYIKEQFIDFEKLARGGLFLISGDTGSGKTTILDAICVALYGKSSGGMRENLESMRCAEAENSQDTYVEFVFENNDRVYRFTRSLKLARKNFNDEHSACVLVEGIFVPLLENPTKSAVNEKALEIIGLTVEQFRQVIILPQGKFETLLTADSAGKEEILTRLFATQRWDLIVEGFNRELRERDARLKTQKAWIDAKINEYDCKDLEQLRLLCEKEELAFAELTALYAERESELIKLKKTIEVMREDKMLFEELDKRQSEFDLKNKEVQNSRDKEKKLALSFEAEKFLPYYSALSNANEEKSKKDRKYSLALENKQNSESKFKALLVKRQEHENSAKDNENKRALVPMLISKRAVYDELDFLKGELDERMPRYEALKSAYANTETELEKAKHSLEEAKVKKDFAAKQCAYAEQRYFDSIGAVIASKLVDGSPCPVCGSIHHPHPKVKTQEHLSEEEYKEYKKEKKKCEKLFDAAFQSFTDTQKKRESAKLARDAMELEINLKKASYDSAYKQKYEGIETLSELEELIDSVNLKISAYENEREEIIKSINDAEASFKASEKLLFEAALAKKESDILVSEKNRLWEEARCMSSFESTLEFEQALLDFDERENLRLELESAHSALVHAKAELDGVLLKTEGKRRPNIEENEKLLNETSSVLDTFKSKMILAKDYSRRLKTDIDILTEALEKLNAERILCDSDLEFAKRLTGSNGIGLKRYVLGVMLTKITSAANRLLATIYGGRYCLFRTDDTSAQSRRAGLELEVLDKRSGERRNVRTLSGGEKFLVALCLAIGLSSVVEAEATGVKLEAMFVDEGFGSLDAQALDDAVEVLEGVQKTSGIVGIISHVERLVETIPNRIDIKKTSEGSECKVVLNL